MFFDSFYLYKKYNVDTEQTHGKDHPRWTQLKWKRHIKYQWGNKRDFLTASLQCRGRAETRIWFSCPLLKCSNDWAFTESTWVSCAVGIVKVGRVFGNIVGGLNLLKELSQFLFRFLIGMQSINCCSLFL